jgi:transcriptional regulator with XRE-family HTH domain
VVAVVELFRDPHLERGRASSPARRKSTPDDGKIGKIDMSSSLENGLTAAVGAVPYPDLVTEATWWGYVVTVTGGAAQKDVAVATGIDQSSISRWQRGASIPRAEAVVALARAYGRSPVEALVDAGYVSSDELGVVELTTLTGDLTGASVDALLSELRRRLLAANPQEAQGWPAGWAGDDPGMGRPQRDEQSGDLGG